MRIAQATRRVVTVLAAAAAFTSASSVRAVAIAHWSFDTANDKGVYADTVGNAHPATAKDAGQVKPFSGDAPFGKAVMFSTDNGQKNSYLSTTPINNMQKTNLTVTAWVYLTKMHANFIITDWKATSDAAWVFGVDLPKAGATIATPIADLRSGETDPGTTNASRKGLHYSIARYSDAKKNVTLNEWHHLAWTWDRNPGVLIVYMDGEVIGTANQAHTPLDLTPAKNNLRIGGREASASGSTGGINMDGAIDELWIFDEVLTPEKIKNMMRFNNTGGTRTLAKVLTRKEDGTITLANPAPPTVEPSTPPAPRPTPPVASNNPPRPRPGGTPAARGNNPRPTPAVEPTPTPTVAAGSGETPQTTADEDLPPVTPAALPSLGSQVIASETPRVAMATKHFTPGRVAGVISCAILSVILSAYLFWAMNERAKIRAPRA